MPDALTFYLNKISRLRTAQVEGEPTPHKPLLLLAVIDLIEQGAILENKIEPSPQLVETFMKYWNVFSLKKARIYLPFYALRSERFWHLHGKLGQEKFYPVKSMMQLASIIAYASLDKDLFLLLLKPETREAIRQKIIETYFSNKAEIIRGLINENQQIHALENLLIQTAEQKKDIDKIIPDTPKRDKAFRGVIMRLYDYTCAACHLRIITLNGETAVEAAHIIPFSISHDDNIGNGVSLCKLHHWAFEIGLISISDKFQIIVSASFEESGNEAFLLRRLQAQTILLPKQKPFFPSLMTIRWHREHRFQK
jgi:putative restriction endonuclease